MRWVDTTGMPSLRDPHPAGPARRFRPSLLAAALGLTALVAGAPALAAGGATSTGPVLEDGVSAEQAARAVDELIAAGTIDGADQVISVGPHGVAVKAESAVKPTSSGGSTKSGGGSTKGGGKKSTGGGGTVIIGDGSGGSSTSYALLSGTGLLTGYTLSATTGTPQYMVDALSGAAADAAPSTGSTFTWGPASTGSEPAPGEIRLSVVNTQVCGSDQAAGCTTTWYDGSRVVKAQVRMRSYVDSSIARCLVGHELGHGLGLAHVSDASQLMNPVFTVGSSPCSYQNGDRAGLTEMGSVKSTL